MVRGSGVPYPSHGEDGTEIPAKDFELVGIDATCMYSANSTIEALG
jgi:hypothetical protein